MNDMPAALWSHTDPDGDSCRLLPGSATGDSSAGTRVAHFHSGPGPVDLDTDALRRLRDACDRLLTGDEDRLTDAGLEATGRYVAAVTDALGAKLAELADAAHLLEPAARDDRYLILAHLLVAVSELTRQVGTLASAVGRVP